MSPTLWRTGRVLAGRTRLRLLRLVIDHPGLNVSDLASWLGLGLSRVSQELRRLQSRGLLRAVRAGCNVTYHPTSDPEVPTAKPLLQAMVTTFHRFSARTDGEIVRVAFAFSHARRLTIARELLRAPRDLPGLRLATAIPRSALQRHLHILQTRGLVRRKGPMYRFRTGRHPLARCMAALLKTAPPSPGPSAATPAHSL